MEEGTISTSVFNFSFKVKCIILLALGLVFYADSINNEYALDDGIVITKNEFVQQGFDGIKGIMSHDAYYSYYHQMNANQMLAGGRYRPLSIVVFAIEHAFFGEDPLFRHAISILAYMACILVVFYFLNNHLLRNLKKGEDIAFLASMLFAIHPMHTEVVANVKSLDEMLSLMCILFTFIFALRYSEAEKEDRKGKDLYLGALFFFLALLAKEYALTLIFLLPILFYTVAKKEPISVFTNTLPYLGVAVLYMLIRIKSVGVPHNVPSDEILNNPYMLATHSQKKASEIYVLGKYLFMLFFPYPLSSDYSYNQLVYRNFADPLVWLCIISYGAIIYWGIKLLMQKKILAFPIFFYLANLAMVTNFVVDVGATMGERLAFHSSLGFIVLLAYAIIRSPEFARKKEIVLSGSFILIVLCGIECTTRNLQWHSDVTLFTHDVNVVPNSVMVLGNAGARYLDMAEAVKDTSKAGKALVSEDINKSIKYLRRSIEMHPTYTNSYLNLGIAFYKLEIPDSAKKYWEYARKLYPDHPNLKQYFPLLAHSYLNQAMEDGKVNNAPAAIIALKKGLMADNTNPDLWYNIGGAYFTIKQWDSARYAWNAALQLKPDYDLAKKGLAALPPQVNNVAGIK